MNWALYGEWTNIKQQWRTCKAQFPQHVRQVELLKLEKVEGHDDFDGEKDEGLPSLIIFNVLAITSFYCSMHLISTFVLFIKFNMQKHNAFEV
jgi:hypothetical protein